jgi:cystathionine beta-lyase
VHWRSKLLHPSTHASDGFQSLVTPVYRGSTVVFDKAADIIDDWRQGTHGYTYGLYGSPTVLELGARIAEIEGAHHCFVVPGGQAAIAVVYLTFCNAGSHGLVPYSAYGSSKEMAAGLLKVLEAAPTPVISGGLKTEIVDAVRREIARFPRCRHQASGMWSLAL